jgi:DNA-binding SARP family transcriptional activator
VDFRILGPLEVVDGMRPVEIGGARPRSLLAILLLHRNQVVPTERLLEHLYGTARPATAAKSLQAHVSRLRKALADGRLATYGGGYLLQTDGDEVDADRFARLLDDGRAATTSGNPSVALPLLEEALGLWRGPALADLAYEEFAQSEIARLDELRVSCLEELAEARLALGRHAELVGELERLVAEHPLRERPRGQLMLALYRSARQADALAAYQDARRTLLDLLGLQPGRALQELERAILAHDPALDPPGVEAARVGASAPSRRRTGGVFVGRERELAELDGALRDARAGHGRLVLVSGEAGIGKTRLIEELAAGARDVGTRIVSGRCWEAGGAPAYWPWVQALRTTTRELDAETLREALGRGAADVTHLLPELRERFPGLPEPPAPDSEGARFRLFDATTAFLRRAAEERPLLVVLDDLQAADAPSLLLLEFVAAELADARLLVVASYRDPEPDAGDPIPALLAALGRRASTRIRLRGLADAEVASFIEQSAAEQPPPALAAAIAAETEGNPLFVAEIVRLLAAEGRLGEEVGAAWRLRVPETVREVIGRRLQRLSEPCHDILEAASVLGRDVPLDVLELLCGQTHAELRPLLDEAEAARAVTDAPGSPGRLRFAHALVRDTLYDALPAGRRRELHAAAARAIEERAGDGLDARLSELAHHLFRALPAVEPASVVDFARRAGDQAGALLAHEEAARLYETALQALALAPAPERGEERAILLSLGEALARAGDSPGAKDAFLRAAVAARDSDAPEDLAQAALGYGGKIVWARPTGDRLVVALLEEGLAGLGPDDTSLRARVLARLAGALRDERDPRRRIEIGELAVATARRVGDTTALVQGLLALSVSQYGFDDQRRLLEVIKELRELARTDDFRESRYEALNVEILLSAALNEFEQVREHTLAQAAVADELREPSRRWFPEAMRALLALHDGQLALAEPLIRDAYALGRHAYPFEAGAAHTIQLYLLRREQRDAAAVHELLAGVAASSPARPFFRCALAALAADVGHLTDTRRLFEELAPDRFGVIPRDNEWPLSAAFLVEACRELGDTRRGEILYEELASLAERSSANPPEGTLGAMARYLGILAAMLGRDDEAAAHLRSAIAIDSETGGRPWVAYAQAELALVLARAGGTEEASALRSEAGRTAAELGLERLAAQVVEAGSQP